MIDKKVITEIYINGDITATEYVWSLFFNSPVILWGLGVFVVGYPIIKVGVYQYRKFKTIKEKEKYARAREVRKKIIMERRDNA